jgi:hypothetical protein
VDLFLRQIKHQVVKRKSFVSEQIGRSAEVHR